MPRKAPPSAAPGFSVAVSEADVRRLCGEGAYARGDALQREGHVFAPSIEYEGLGAQVLGTWQRVDVVRVKAGGGQLTSECSCRSGPFCRHAAALLLHWLRSRDSFAEIVEEGPSILDREARAGELDYFDEDDEDLDPVAPYAEQGVTPEEEYARLLEPETMQKLRALASRRGLRVVAKNKVEMVAQLARLLSGRAGIEATIATLGDDARLTLEVANLLGAVSGAGTTAAAIIRACSTLGLAAKPSAQHFPALETLADLALVVRTDTYTSDAANCWVPYAVAAAIPPRGVLLGMSST
ncbi:MAG: SWIM zinc finger family protein, partial [Chloroflexota bacterium]|nr:SWIM zinc finger family protein [Chloroflexota bacterium]